MTKAHGYHLAGLSLAACFLLSACSPPELVDMSQPLNDGEYVGKSNPDEQDAIGIVTITVTDGKITSTSYETVTKDGEEKGVDYGKTSQGEVGNREFYQRAQAAVASYDEYAAQLTEKQDPTEVDVISGATVAHSQFLQAAVRAVLQAQGLEDDGAADSINMPSLDLDETDY
ncbi:MAG: FMN-binding protein [Bowdeniella nasicola]|nr:FMN-binding protein [Bowdeniella nasicola]